jgi:hypothetical protein
LGIENLRSHSQLHHFQPKEIIGIEVGLRLCNDILVDKINASPIVSNT